MLPSGQASVQHSSITAHVLRAEPSGNATVCRSGYRLAVQYCSISETCFRFFSNPFSKKKDRAAFAGGPSQGGDAPGKGSDGRGRAIA
jgi:hypothetical protein